MENFNIIVDLFRAAVDPNDSQYKNATQKISYLLINEDKDFFYATYQLISSLKESLSIEILFMGFSVLRRILEKSIKYVNNFKKSSFSDEVIMEILKLTIEYFNFEHNATRRQAVDLFIIGFSSLYPNILTGSYNYIDYFINKLGQNISSSEYKSISHVLAEICCNFRIDINAQIQILKFVFKKWKSTNDLELIDESLCLLKQLDIMDIFSNNYNSLLNFYSSIFGFYVKNVELKRSVLLFISSTMNNELFLMCYKHLFKCIVNDLLNDKAITYEDENEIAFFFSSSIQREISIQKYIAENYLSLFLKLSENINTNEVHFVEENEPFNNFFQCVKLLANVEKEITPQIIFSYIFNNYNCENQYCREVVIKLIYSILICYTDEEIFSFNLNELKSILLNGIQESYPRIQYFSLIATTALLKRFNYKFSEDFIPYLFQLYPNVNPVLNVLFILIRDIGFSSDFNSPQFFYDNLCKILLSNIPNFILPKVIFCFVFCFKHTSFLSNVLDLMIDLFDHLLHNNSEPNIESINAICSFVSKIYMKINDPILLNYCDTIAKYCFESFNLNPTGNEIYTVISFAVYFPNIFSNYLTNSLDALIFLFKNIQNSSLNIDIKSILFSIDVLYIQEDLDKSIDYYKQDLLNYTIKLFEADLEPETYSILFGTLSLIIRNISSEDALKYITSKIYGVIQNIEPLFLQDNKGTYSMLTELSNFLIKLDQITLGTDLNRSFFSLCNCYLTNVMEQKDIYLPIFSSILQLFQNLVSTHNNISNNEIYNKILEISKMNN